MNVPVPLRHRGFIITVFEDRGEYLGIISDPMDLAEDFVEFRHAALVPMLRNASRYIDRMCDAEATEVAERVTRPTGLPER